MNDTIPWRGAREKHPKFMQILIESLTKEGDIVLDWQTNTGTVFFSTNNFLYVDFLVFVLRL